MTTSPVRLSIIIVNWNGTDDTVECLASIPSAQSNDVTLDVIVVDNGSKIDPTNPIRVAYPQAKLIRLDRNLGFAAGCNIGIKKAIERDADFILLLNNDTVIQPGLFETLVRSVGVDAKIGIVGPLIYATDGKGIDFAGAEINFALGKFKHLQHEREAKERSYETDYVSGCCMMISRTVIEQAGLLDEKLFAYFEDVDLCVRAREAEFRIAYVPNASVLHKGSASTRRTLAEGDTSALKHYLIARNRTIIVRRYAPALAKLLYVFVATPVRLAFYTCAFLAKRRWTKLRAFWRGTLDGLRSRSGVPPEAFFS